MRYAYLFVLQTIRQLSAMMLKYTDLTNRARLPGLSKYVTIFKFTVI